MFHGGFKTFTTKLQRIAQLIHRCFKRWSGVLLPQPKRHRVSLVQEEDPYLASLLRGLQGRK